MSISTNIVFRECSKRTRNTNKSLLFFVRIIAFLIRDACTTFGLMFAFPQGLVCCSKSNSQTQLTEIVSRGYWKGQKTLRDSGRVAGVDTRPQTTEVKPSTLSEPTGDVRSCWLTPSLAGDTQGVQAEVNFGSGDIWASWPWGLTQFHFNLSTEGFFFHYPLTRNVFYPFNQVIDYFVAAET